MSGPERTAATGESLQANNPAAAEATHSMELQMQTDTATKPSRVQIGDVDLDQIFYRGEPVVTLVQIDKAHKRPDDTAGRNFRANKSTRFQEGVDYHSVSSDEIRRISPDAIPAASRREVTLITRRGYLKLVKSLNDDLAWSVFDDMVERYFAVERQQPASIADLLANPGQLLTLAQGYALQIEDLKRDVSGMKHDVEALDRIAGADNLYGLRQTAQILQQAERAFVKWLQQERWIYRQNGSKVLMAYADKRPRFMTHKLEAFTKEDGSEGTRETLKFTTEGIVKLAKMIGVVPEFGVESGRVAA